MRELLSSQPLCRTDGRAQSFGAPIEQAGLEEIALDLRRDRGGGRLAARETRAGHCSGQAFHITTPAGGPLFDGAPKREGAGAQQPIEPSGSARGARTDPTEAR